MEISTISLPAENSSNESRRHLLYRIFEGVLRIRSQLHIRQSMFIAVGHGHLQFVCIPFRCFYLYGSSPTCSFGFYLSTPLAIFTCLGPLLPCHLNFICKPQCFLIFVGLPPSDPLDFIWTVLHYFYISMGPLLLIL